MIVKTSVQQQWTIVMPCDNNCEKDYSEEYDAYFCGTCNKWLEDKCNDPECEYCPARPATPM